MVSKDTLGGLLKVKRRRESEVAGRARVKGVYGCRLSEGGDAIEWKGGESARPRRGRVGRHMRL